MEPQGILRGFNRPTLGTGTCTDPLDRPHRRPWLAGALSLGQCRDRSDDGEKPASKVIPFSEWKVIAWRGVSRRRTEERPLVRCCRSLCAFKLGGLFSVRRNRVQSSVADSWRALRVCDHSVGIPPDPS